MPTTAEAATALGLSIGTVRNYTLRGTLAATHLANGRIQIPDNEIERYNRERRGIGQRAEPMADRFWRQVDRRGVGCWPWLGSTNTQGYGFFKRDGKTVRAHRVAWELESGHAPPERVQVCHHCDNPPCVRPDHLFLGAAKDNLRDMSAKGRGSVGAKNGTHTHPGRVVRGERVNTARLSADDVRSIRDRYAAGESQPELAGVFGVSQPAISALILRRSWAHVL